MERLIVCKTDRGNYAVRPIDWSGIWDADGRIQECGINHTAIFAEKEDAEWYANTKNSEEQGLLLRFLCKIGDTVFFRDKGRETILPVTIENIRSVEGKCCIEYFGWFFNGYGEPTMGFTFTENDFGNTVFLTEEEAKARLKELEGSEDK